MLFMETYMLRGGRRNHAVLEAFPVTERQLEKAKWVAARGEGRGERGGRGEGRGENGRR